MPNLYKSLRALFPEPPLLVGDVIAYADGEATIEMLDGNVTKARGEAAVNDRVYFRDGVIEGPAPTLDYFLIEV